MNKSTNLPVLISICLLTACVPGPNTQKGLMVTSEHVLLGRTCSLAKNPVWQEKGLVGRSAERLNWGCVSVLGCCSPAAALCLYWEMGHSRASCCGFPQQPASNRSTAEATKHFDFFYSVSGSLPSSDARWERNKMAKVQRCLWSENRIHGVMSESSRLRLVSPSQMHDTTHQPQVNAGAETEASRKSNPRPAASSLSSVLPITRLIVTHFLCQSTNELLALNLAAQRFSPLNLFFCGAHLPSFPHLLVNKRVNWAQLVINFRTWSNSVGSADWQQRQQRWRGPGTDNLPLAPAFACLLPHIWNYRSSMAGWNTIDASAAY